MPDEPRIGRKVILAAVAGVFFALLLPLLGFVAIVFLALAWIFLILIWVITAAQVRRPVLYITVFTLAYLVTIFLLGKLGIAITYGAH